VAKVDLSVVAERLFLDFMAPLVLGGAMTPGRPIGGRAILELGVERKAADIDRHAHVQLARIRVARALCPIDHLEPAAPAEWALSACLHDLVQSAHPGLKGLFSGDAPDKLVAMVEEALGRIGAPATVHDALSRHTWFSRIFEIERTDTTVSNWLSRLTGVDVFLGEAPPPRLLAWPERRRVRVEKTPRTLTELSVFGGHVDRSKFLQTLARFLSKSPLTDLATLDRSDPPFQWSAETLGLIATRPGRTLALRALRDLPEAVVSAALGRATRAILPSLDPARAWPGTFFALALLGDRMLENALGALNGHHGAAQSPVLSAQDDVDASFARSAGALVTRTELTQNPSLFSETHRSALLALLRPFTESAVGRELEKASSYFLPPALSPTGSFK